MNTSTLDDLDLREAQVLASAFIERNQKCAVFGDIGIGKCGATLDALVKLIDSLEVEQALVVGPKNVVLATWPEELRIWSFAHGIDYEVLHGAEPGRVHHHANGERRIRLWEKKVERRELELKVAWEGIDFAAPIPALAEMEAEIAVRTRRLAYARRVLKWGYCAARRPATLHLINRENLSWLVAFWGKFWPYDCVVYDESADLKNGRKVLRWRAMRAVMPFTKRMIQLTGTPSPKGQIDLWGQIYIIDGGARLGRSLTAFRDRYFNAEHDGYGYKLRNEDDIPKAIKDVCLTLDAKDFMDMPPTIHTSIPVILEDADMKRYKEFEKEYVMELDGGEIEAVNEAVLGSKLFQLANGVVYDPDKVPRHFHHAKLDALAEYISEMQGGNFLLAYYYKHDLERILKRFKQIVPFSLDKIEPWNKGRVQIMAVHPLSVGEGMNIQYGGRHLLYYGPLPTRDAKAYMQLNGRLEGARAVGLGTTFIGTLVAKGTFDELGVQILEGREGAQRAFKQRLKELRELS